MLDELGVTWVLFFFSFFVSGSHLPMSRKLLGDFASLLGGQQSPIKWYNEKEVV